MRGAVAALRRVPGRIAASLLRRRSLLPDAVTKLIDGVLENPNGRLYRVMTRVAEPYSEDSLPAATRAPVSRPAVYIAPANYAGQGHQWARALRAAGMDAVAMAVVAPGGYGFAADTVVPASVQAGSARWQAAEYEAASAYTHVLVEAERSLFGPLMGTDVRREVGALQERGVSVAMISHGTDARIPSLHAARSPLSPFHQWDAHTAKLERVAERNVALLTELGLPTFVSTPDLLDDLPFAHWCPVVVEAERWTAPRAPSPGPLRVVHAPTNRQLKGTDLVEPVLAALHSEGVIRYRRIEGVAHHEMPTALAGADVLLDQFRLGSYSGAAVEAMAAGCAVVGHVFDGVRERVARTAGESLPIVEATPESLESALRLLAADRDRVAEIGLASAAFARTVHDGRMSARVLDEHWIGEGTTR